MHIHSHIAGMGDDRTTRGMSTVPCSSTKVRAASDVFAEDVQVIASSCSYSMPMNMIAILKYIIESLTTHVIYTFEYSD